MIAQILLMHHYHIEPFFNDNLRLKEVYKKHLENENDEVVKRMHDLNHLNSINLTYMVRV